MLFKFLKHLAWPVVRAVHDRNVQQYALVFSMAVAFARNDEQFGLLVGDSTGYSSTGLRRVLVALFPDSSTYSLANLSFLQAQLRLPMLQLSAR